MLQPFPHRTRHKPAILAEGHTTPLPDPAQPDAARERFEERDCPRTTTTDGIRQTGLTMPAWGSRLSPQVLRRSKSRLRTAAAMGTPADALPWGSPSGHR